MLIKKVPEGTVFLFFQFFQFFFEVFFSGEQVSFLEFDAEGIGSKICFIGLSQLAGLIFV